MADLHVDFLGKRAGRPGRSRPPAPSASARSTRDIEDLRVLGGISGKGLTLNGQPGNEGERLYETPSGLMNSIGLQNPGVQHFIDHELPAMRAVRHHRHGPTWAASTIEDIRSRACAMLCAGRMWISSS